MTRGEAINARASAGSRMVDLRARHDRLQIPSAAPRIMSVSPVLEKGLAVLLRSYLRVCDDLTIAEIDYAAALGVEQSFEGA
jgi:hypothetical protein